MDYAQQAGEGGGAGGGTAETREGRVCAKQTGAFKGPTTFCPTKDVCFMETGATQVNEVLVLGPTGSSFQNATKISLQGKCRF